MLSRCYKTPALKIRPKPVFTQKKGVDLMHDSLYNKGTSFCIEERDRLGLRGLVPPRYVPLEEQKQRSVRRLKNITDPVDKYNFLMALEDANETLFYKIVGENIKDLAPIIYTPTVGEVCMKFSAIFRRPRGMYFSLHDRGHMHSMVHNWPEDDVEVIVVTDGSRVLGLGDLGAQGMGISVGKVSLYVAGGGINPRRTLPVTLDVGTNNETLLNFPLYLGLKENRLVGQDYYHFVDEFMDAVMTRWPNVLLQFEDFNNAHALPLLEKYRHEHLVFNDDIQGTGAMAASGVFSAVKQRDGNLADLPNDRIVIVGAGSAGLGVANTIAFTMMQELGISPGDTYKRFYLLDKDGLLGKDSARIIQPQKPFQADDLPDGISLLEVIKEVKPTMLLGLSGVGGLFTEEVIKEMYKHVKRPIIFPLSNPTRNSECTAEDAYIWTEGNAIVASGSPFPPTVVNGVTLTPSQGNNMFVFPGLGLATTSVKAKRISYRMMNMAAIALSETLNEEEIAKGMLYPSIERITDVSLHVAEAGSHIKLLSYDPLLVAKACFSMGYARINKPANLKAFLKKRMWRPEYADIIYNG